MAAAKKTVTKATTPEVKVELRKETEAPKVTEPVIEEAKETEPTPTAEFQEPLPEPAKAEPTEASLMKDGRCLRTYTLETHGKDFAKLAGIYKSHKGGEIILN